MGSVSKDPVDGEMLQGWTFEIRRARDRKSLGRRVPDCRPYHWSCLVAGLLAMLAQRLARHLAWLHRTFESQMQ